MCVWARVCKKQAMQKYKPMNQELSITFMRVCMKNVFKFLNVQQKLEEEGKKFRILKLRALLSETKGQQSLNICTTYILSQWPDHNAKHRYVCLLKTEKKNLWKITLKNY